MIKEFYDKLEAAGHTLKRDEDGNVEYFEMVGFHGGPICSKCGDWWCLHCDDLSKSVYTLPCKGEN